MSGWDPCLVHLEERLYPECKANLCGSTCCHYLSFESRDCSENWREAYAAEANVFRTRMHATCEENGVAHACHARRQCEWSTLITDSPCFAPECLTYFTTDTMTAGCAHAIHAYCEAHGSAGEIFIDKRKCDARAPAMALVEVVAAPETFTEMAPLQTADEECLARYCAMGRDSINVSVTCWDLIQFNTSHGGAGCQCVVGDLAAVAPADSAPLVFLYPCIFTYCDLFLDRVSFWDICSVSLTLVLFVLLAAYALYALFFPPLSSRTKSLTRPLLLSTHNPNP